MFRWLQDLLRFSSCLLNLVLLCNLPFSIQLKSTCLRPSHVVHEHGEI